MLKARLWGRVFGVLSVLAVSVYPDLGRGSDSPSDPSSLCPAVLDAQGKMVLASSLPSAGEQREQEIDRLSELFLQLDPSDRDSRGRVAEEIDRIVQHQEWAQAGEGRVVLERSIAEITHSEKGSILASDLRALRKAVRRASPPRHFLPRFLDYRWLHPILKRCPQLPQFLSSYIVKFRAMREVIDGIVQKIDESRAESEGRAEGMFLLSAELYRASEVLQDRASFLEALILKTREKAQNTALPKPRQLFLDIVVLEKMEKSLGSLRELDTIFITTYMDMLRILRIAEQINGQAADAKMISIPAMERMAATLTTASRERERVEDLKELGSTVGDMIRSTAEALRDLQTELDKLLDAPLIRAETLLYAAQLTRDTENSRRQNAEGRLAKATEAGRQLAKIVGQVREQAEQDLKQLR